MHMISGDREFEEELPDCRSTAGRKITAGYQQVTDS